MRGPVIFFSATAEMTKSCAKSEQDKAKVLLVVRAKVKSSSLPQPPRPPAQRSTDWQKRTERCSSRVNHSAHGGAFGPVVC